MRQRYAVAAVLSCVILPFAGCAAPPVAPPSPGLPAPYAPEPTVTGPVQRPSDVLDLSDWYLTLPTGSDEEPDTVDQPELGSYSSDWFRVATAGPGVAFTANAGGTTTSGSNYPRSELREMDGTEKASWSNESGVHTLRVREAVTALPPVKPEVVTAQIHDDDDDVMEVRLEGTTLIAQYDDGDRDIVLDPDYQLGAVFDLEIVAEQSRIEVRYTAAESTSTATIPSSGSGWYFKAGSYLQSNTERGDEPDAVGTVVIYDLDVEHSPS